MKKKIIAAVLAASLCTAFAVPNFVLPVYADDTIIIEPPVLPDEPKDEITYEPIYENWVASDYTITETVEDVVVNDSTATETVIETVYENWVADNYTITETVEDVIVNDSTATETVIETVYENWVADNYTITETVEDVIVNDSTATETVIETVYENWVADDYTITETVEDTVITETVVEDEVTPLLGDWGKEDIWEVNPDDNNIVEEGKCNHDSSATCELCYKKEVVWENEIKEDEISLHLGDWGKEDIWEVNPDDNTVVEGKCNHDSSATCSNCYKKEVIWEN